jgi:hypothetical protein
MKLKKKKEIELLRVEFFKNIYIQLKKDSKNE